MDPMEALNGKNKSAIREFEVARKLDFNLPLWDQGKQLLATTKN